MPSLYWKGVEKPSAVRSPTFRPRDAASGMSRLRPSLRLRYDEQN